jgi:hypothetical protein
LKRTLIAIVMALALMLIPVGSALADSSVNVTVTATPGYLSIDVAPTDWTINGISGDGIVRTGTTYYANPLGDETAPTGISDGECRFTFTNDGNLDVDITCNMDDFSGGDANMTNSDGGYTSNGNTSFGASGYYSGGTWDTDAVTFASSGSSTFISGLTVSNTIKWGVALLTQTDPFAGSAASSSIITCTASEH